MIEKITIDNLAEMVKRGFDATATKEDVQQIATGLGQVATGLGQVTTDLEQVTTDLEKVATDLQTFRGETNARLDHLDARVGRIEADIHDLQEGVVYRHEFEDVLGRIKYIERKLGIESGVE